MASTLSCEQKCNYFWSSYYSSLPETHLILPQSADQSGASIRLRASIEAVQLAGHRCEGTIRMEEAGQQRFVISLLK